jgi:hypothetical protein
MLIASRKHSETTKILLNENQKKFKSIPHVSTNEYLDYLRTAIPKSEKFLAVQRKPIRWFTNGNGSPTNGGFYLEALRDNKNMKKTRIFVIDERDLAEMEEDIKDENQVLSSYWKYAGEDVVSYWTTTSKLNEFGRQIFLGDFAIYDDELYISYNHECHVLDFDIIDTKSEKLEIFRELERQRRLEMGRSEISEPFTKIRPPSDSTPP